MHRLSRLLLTLLALCTVGSARAAWLYDGYPIYNLGPAIGKGRTTDMVAQPFSVPRQCRMDQIGVALASGMDPHHAGFRVILATDPYDLGKTTIAEWRLFAVSGPTLAFAYQAVKPVLLQAGSTYHIVVAPGDSEVTGAVAYAYQGNPALATNDDGANWFDVAQLGVRVGGTVVPEPSSLAVLGVGCWVLGYRRWKPRQVSVVLPSHKA